MGKARAEIEISASAQRLAADLTRVTNQMQNWSAAVARGMDRQFSKVGKNIGKGISSGGVAIGSFGGNLLTKGFDKLVEAGHDVLDFERDLLGLQITAKQTTAWSNQMRDAIRGVSKETAVNSEEILKATARYVDLTGDVAGATTMMRTFARVAQASNSNIRDVAETAAAAADAFHVKPEEMEAMFSGLIEQGKAGAIAVKDLGAELTSLAPRFARFKGMMGVDGMMQIGAAMQVAKHGFHDASETATGLVSMMGGMTLHADKFAAAGVKIFEMKNGEKVFRNLHDIVVDIGNSKLAKDPTALIKAFGRKEGEQAFQQLNRLKGMYDEMYEAGKKTNTVAEDLATKLNSPIGRIDASLNLAKVRIAEIFTPERIEAFATALEGVVGTLAGALDRIESVWDRITGKRSENPFEVTPEAPAPGVMDIYRSPLMAGKKQLEHEQAIQTHDAIANMPGPRGDQERAQIANRASYDKTYDEIANQKNRSEQVRAAERIIAANAESKEPGAQGRFKAGHKYEYDYHVSEQEKAYGREANSKALAESLAPVLNPLTAAIGALQTAVSKIPLPTVKIGDDQVAQSASKAKGARGGWGE